MANFLSQIQRLIPWQNKEYCILMLGNSNAGKTTLLYRWKLNQALTTVPTIGFNVESIRHKGFNYVFWDIGSSRSIRKLVHHYVQNSNAHVLYMFSVTDTPAFLDDSLDCFVSSAQSLMNTGPRTMWLIFNKQESQHRGISTTEYTELIKNRLRSCSPETYLAMTLKVLDVPQLSALTGQGCTQLLDVIRDAILEADSPILKEEQRERTENDAEIIPSAPKTSVGTQLLDQTENSQNESTTQEELWRLVIAGEITDWSHHNRLRILYMLLIRVFHAGGRIVECTDAYLDLVRTSQRGKVSGDQIKFGNRTMIMFWLHQLMLSISEFQRDYGQEKLLAPELLPQILRCNPYLSMESLWSRYFSSELMECLDSIKYWRLPDLRPLPQSVVDVSNVIDDLSENLDESYRLMGFAFEVIHLHLLSKAPRGWIVQQALPILQSTTMRLRVKNPGIPQYSETKALFWIQVTHETLSPFKRLMDENYASPERWSILTYSQFRRYFGLPADLWKKHYSLELWNSTNARMEFVVPDKLPLSDRVDQSLLRPPPLREVLGNRDSVKHDFAMELPSIEALRLRVAISLAVLRDESRSDSSLSPSLQDHARLLKYLFEKIDFDRNEILEQDQEARQSWIEDVARGFPGLTPDSMTVRAFWALQIDEAVKKNCSSRITFDAFLHANIHLVFEDLILYYYSAKLLSSVEAKYGIVQPDRRQSKLTYSNATNEGQMPNIIMQKYSDEQAEENEWEVI